MKVQRITKAVLFIGMMIILFGKPFAAFAGDDIACALYAQTAVAQNKENISKGCGFTGPRWNSDYSRHMNWCMGVSLAQSESENKVRTKALNNCSGGTWQLDAHSRCEQYALIAVAQNHIAKGCNFTGPRWNSDYGYHYRWCMKVPKAHADSGTIERQESLKKCKNISYPPEPVPTSHKGDLAAFDWCYYQIGGEITFYPIIKNVGPTDWASEKEGYYKIGVEVGTIFKEKKYTLNAFPYWSLKKEDPPDRLQGITLVFHPENSYRVVNIWELHHPEDTNAGNNFHKGDNRFLKGEDFLENGKMYGKRCKTPWE